MSVLAAAKNRMAPLHTYGNDYPPDPEIRKEILADYVSEELAARTKAELRSLADRDRAAADDIYYRRERLKSDILDAAEETAAHRQRMSSALAPAEEYSVKDIAYVSGGVAVLVIIARWLAKRRTS